MGRAFDAITDQMCEFIERQHVFFVATAPSGDDGRVNLSPKGYDSFRVLGPNRVAYLDLTGSGAETIAHVRQNGRITFMFCAFEGKPNIVRLYGRARVIAPSDTDAEDISAHFTDAMDPPEGATRSLIVAEIDRTSNSCGYSIPFMEYVEERPRLIEWADAKDTPTLDAYRAEKNRTSIDGLPALD